MATNAAATQSGVVLGKAGDPERDQQRDAEDRGGNGHDAPYRKGINPDPVVRARTFDLVSEAAVGDAMDTLPIVLVVSCATADGASPQKSSEKNAVAMSISL